MLIGERTLQHLAIKRDVRLTQFLACRARRHVVVMHRLQVVHPWEPGLHVERQDVPLRQLVVHVQPDVLYRLLLLCIYHLVEGVPCP